MALGIGIGYGVPPPSASTKVSLGVRGLFNVMDLCFVFPPFFRPYQETDGQGTSAE
jgi:hypothetical protein